MQHLIEYREGAQLILNDDYEKELVHGKGRSYGIELFASKTTGKFTGWAGYSLSWAHRTFDSLNGGREYFARYDRRHDLSLVGMYDLGGQYLVPKPDFSGFESLPAYTGRNELRMSAAFRVDLDLGYKFTIGKRLKCDAHLSMYNVLNRTQPNRVQRVWDSEKGAYSYEQKGLFGNITTASINFNL
jgi:outer membrane receptor protein involved in Fe transport